MSFFSSKKEEEKTAPAQKGVIGTGGKVDEMVAAMIIAANDSESDVRVGISRSLTEIGKKQPNLVLSSCWDFMIHNPKLSKEHKIILLSVIHQVLELKRDDIRTDLASQLIILAMNEMVTEKEVIPEWQTAASQVLVSLGLRFPNEILDELMKKFPIGNIPHYFVVKTLGDFVKENPHDTVPRLKEVFARILPILAGIKHENMKWVFASTIGHFCEAILHFEANTRNTPKYLKADHFASDVFPAYEILYGNWLMSKETPVKLASLQALGTICAVLSKDQLETQLQKLIPTLLSFYKKEKEHLPITQGLSSILWVAVKDDSRMLEPLIPILLATLHQLALVNPEFSHQNSSVKNYNELLRCIQTIGLVFSDNLIGFLIDHLNTKDLRARAGTVSIIKHLITHIAVKLYDKKGLIISGLKPFAQGETNFRVRREISASVIAMAAHDYLTCDGGEALIEFVIRMCAISDEEIQKWDNDKSKDKDNVSPGELRGICDSILQLTSTTIDCMQPVYWPYLFEFLVPAKYTHALSSVCRALGHLANLKRAAESPDYIIDFDKAINLPKPHAIVARLLVMLNYPNRRGELGVCILNFLKAAGPILHPSIWELWDTTLPKLLGYLETNLNKSEWNATVWEDLVLRLLSETVKAANDEEWTTQYGEQLVQQYESYDDPETRRIVFKHLGLILQKSSHKTFIAAKLEWMLSVANGNSEAERSGCAMGIGYAAASHLDTTLEKLTNAAKGPVKPEKKSGGIFSFMSSKDETLNDVNNAYVLCYGYITAYSNPSLITSRIDISIINPLKAIIAKCRTNATKECILKSMELIAKAMHPQHLKRDFKLQQRDDLIKSLIIFLTVQPQDKSKKEEQLPDSLKIMALSALSHFVNLEPILPLELEKAVLDKVMPFYGSVESKLITQVIESLNLVLNNILQSQPSVECLVRLFKTIEPYVCSRDLSQRERSITTVAALLKKFCDIKAREENKKEKCFAEVGPVIAMLIPRCTDPHTFIRRTAIECIQLSTCVDFILKKNFVGNFADIPPEVMPFSEFITKISTSDLNDQYSTVHEMSRTLSKLVSSEEIADLILASLKGLTDSQVSSTNGTCVIVNGLIKTRGKELSQRIPAIVGGLISGMETIVNEQTMNGTLHAIRNLATHNLLAVLDKLLAYPVPHSTFVVKSLHSIAKDEALLLQTIDHFQSILNTSQLYEEKSDPKTKVNGFSANPTVMSATCALGELFLLGEAIEDIVLKHYSRLLTTILLRIGTSNGMIESHASDQISSTLKSFIECSKDNFLEITMTRNDNYGKIKTREYYKTITSIAETIGKSRPDEMTRMYEFLLPFMKGNFIGQKVVSATVIAEFVNHCKYDQKLLQNLINTLLLSLSDVSVKLQSLRGLGNIVSVSIEEANKYAPTILDALISSIDDQNDSVAMEAMNGLSKIFSCVEESRMAPIMINLCHRIRPAFDKDNAEIRSAAFHLFGSLSRFGKGTAGDAFYEQIHNNFPSIILHLNDDSDLVRAACKGCLRNIAGLMRNEKVGQLLSHQRLDPQKTFLDYPEFLNDLSIVLIEAFPERLNPYVMTCVEPYFKSSWNIIKSNAAAFVGFLLGNLPIEKRKLTTLNPSLVSKAIISLLKEKSPLVRKAAADAMSLLFHY